MRRLACEGSVMGAVANARRKRTPRELIASMAGVRASAQPYAPTRSARSVSTVMITTVRIGPAFASGTSARAAGWPPLRTARNTAAAVRPIASRPMPVRAIRARVTPAM